MKLLHIADLHLGKSMNECRLYDSDQPYWIKKFLETVKETAADAVLIAGDIYDRSSPSDEAVALFDGLISGLAELGVPALIVAGNHDSGQKLGFAGSLLEKGNVYIAGIPSAQVKHVTLSDEYGEAVFWLVPYIYPQIVSRVLECGGIKDYDAAFRKLIAAQEIDFSKRNVIVAHQNVTRGGKEPERGGSENSVAGVGGIDCSAFDGFEYAALGHIHAAQYIGRESVRYAGSPLCYHFDETRFSKKGSVLIDLKAKGEEPEVSVIPIEPLHPVRIVRGTFEEISARETDNPVRGEYLRAEISGGYDADKCRTLRSIAEMHDSVFLEIVSAAEKRTLSEADGGGNADAENMSAAELFCEFYRSKSSGAPLGKEEEELIAAAAAELERADINEKNIEKTVAEKIIAAARAQEGIK